MENYSSSNSGSQSRIIQQLLRNYNLRNSYWLFTPTPHFRPMELEKTWLNLRVKIAGNSHSQTGRCKLKCSELRIQRSMLIPLNNFRKYSIFTLKFMHRKFEKGTSFELEQLGNTLFLYFYYIHSIQLLFTLRTVL